MRPSGLSSLHPPASPGLVLKRALRSAAGPVRAQLSAAPERQERVWWLEGRRAVSPQGSPGWGCFKLPGSGCLSTRCGEGAVLGGALPLGKAPAAPGPLQALRLGDRCPRARHRPWAGHGSGGQTLLEICWPVRASSPLPLQPQGAPVWSSDVRGDRGPHSGHPGSSGHHWGPGILCWSTEPRAWNLGLPGPAQGRNSGSLAPRWGVGRQQSPALGPCAGAGWRCFSAWSPASLTLTLLPALLLPPSQASRGITPSPPACVTARSSSSPSTPWRPHPCTRLAVAPTTTSRSPTKTSSPV